MGGFSPAQGQEPTPNQANSYHNGFGGGTIPTAPMGQPQMQPQPQPVGLGQMPAPNSGIAPAPVPPMPEPKSKNTLIETIILVVVCIIAAVAIVFAVYFYMQWNDLNTNFTAEKDRAVAEAQREQREVDDANLQETLKRETVQFTGPDDFGRVNFYYPKIWSVYEAQDGTRNSDYRAYFAPAPVNSLDDEASRYAVRFEILNQSYDDVASQYASMVREGVLTTQPFTADNGKITGTRYEGNLTEAIHGILVIAKVNDKTLLLQTDSSEVYTEDFNKILSSLRRGN